MDDNQPKPRRWFRFSLRTMFVLVTVGCIGVSWTVYQLNWIWERSNRPGVSVGFAVGQAPSAPWPLWLLGEQGYQNVQVTVVSDEGFLLQTKDWDASMEKSFQNRLLTADDQKSVERLKRLFPEATNFGARFIPRSAAAQVFP